MTLTYYKNSYLWSLIAAELFLSIQILAVIIYIYSFVPLVWDDSFLKGLEPTRDSLFYAIFLGLNVVLMALSVKFVLPKLNSPQLWRQFKFWLCLESMWCFLILFCFFKWTTYRYPFWNILAYENKGWVQPLFCLVCGLAVLSKLFFPEISKLWERVSLAAGKQSLGRRYTVALQLGFIAALFFLLYIPRPKEAVALGFAWDQFNHLDRVAGWFIRHGWFPSYEQTIQMLVVAAFVYIVGLFYFIRVWLKSWLLAAIGALLALKMGLFYYGASPCVWIYPGNTFLIHGWDIFLFFGLWLVSVRFPKKFYAIAGLVALGLVVAWIKSNGLIDVVGLDNQPMMAPLRVRQFFPFFMGYFIPVFYVLSLIVTRERMVVALGVYGLMIFVDYIEHPATGYYGALIVPALLILLWGIKQLSSSLTLSARRLSFAGIFVVVTGAVLTNRLMLIYPNAIFQDQQRFVQEKTIYQQFDTYAIAPSAVLIRQLTPADQKILLVSNFEVALSLKAHRQSIFKDFPVMFSQSTNGLGGLRLNTKKQCMGMINSMQNTNAPYAFVDARLWILSQQSLGISGLGVVLSYLHNHYNWYGRQGFLEALQRKQ